MSNPTRVMVDIESLGTEPGAAILSIGAVPFDTDDVDATAGFYSEVDLRSCEAAGLTIDADTLLWWQGQSDEAKAVLSDGGGDLADVLDDFAGWYVDVGADEVWANSPSFDCRLLGAAFDAVGVECPWGYYDERDFRTLRTLPGFVDARDKHDGTNHDAFDDAVGQALSASATLRRLADAE